MDIIDRIIKIRENRGDSQEKFASRLGLSRNFINQVENRKKNISDRTISDICREFDVNEEWLKNGTGEVYIARSRNQAITDFAADLILDEDESFKKRLIEVLAQLSVEEWEILEELAMKLSKKS